MRDAASVPLIQWANQMTATSKNEPERLVPMLTGAILGCGGWVLSRGATDTGIVNLLFEFERNACIEIYSVLIAAGVELSRAGHVRLTELCQCALLTPDQSEQITSIDLEIQTVPAKQSEDIGDGSARALRS